MNTEQRQALWQKIQYQLYPAKAHALMPQDKQHTGPWYVRLMLGVSAWIAALFLFAFVAATFAFVLKSGAASAMLGLLVLAGAWSLFRLTSNDFAVQFGLALSMAGQGLLVNSILQIFRGDALAGQIALCLLELGLLVLPNFISRLVCTCTALFALNLALGKMGISFLFPGMAALGLVIWCQLELPNIQRASLLTPVGFGVLLTLIFIAGNPLWAQQMPGFDWYLPRIGVLLALAWVIWLQCEKQGLVFGSVAGVTVLLAGILFALLAWWVPGLGVAGLVITLGFSTGNRIVLALGWCSFAWYLGHFYYDLHSSLLDKSKLLIASGAALLLARLALQKLFPLEPNHA
ncbi:MAG: hypothetical protein RL748_1445 [Pseudomonadota bacterium]